MDSDDDLYGPLPEDLGIIPDDAMGTATDMEVDDITGGEPSHTGHVPSSEYTSETETNYNREAPWIRLRYTSIIGDSWDRLLRRRNAPVPSRPRTKIKAKKLGRHQSGSLIEVEGMVNFVADEWIKRRREA